MNRKSASTLFSLFFLPTLALAEARSGTPVYQGDEQDAMTAINDLSNKAMPRNGGDKLFYRDTKNNRVGVGTVSPSVTLDVAGFIGGAYPMIQVRDHETQGTAGGTLTSGSWQTRTLNTVTTNTISGASLSSNRITLPSGTYYATFSAPGFMVDRHQVRISSITGAAVQILGQNAYADAANSVQSNSQGDGVFTVPASSSTQIELQHRCSTTRAGNGLGVEVNVSTEVYGIVNIWQIRQ